MTPKLSCMKEVLNCLKVSPEPVPEATENDWGHDQAAMFLSMDNLPLVDLYFEGGSSR